MSEFISLLAILALDDSRPPTTQTQTQAAHHCSRPWPTPGGQEGCHRSSTLQLTQKLDAYGIWAARVYWTIGPPRVCAAPYGTLPEVHVK